MMDLTFEGFPRGIESMEKSLEFGQNVNKVLKKYGNPKFSHLFIQILFLSTDSLQLMTIRRFFALCSMNKILEK